MSTVVKTIEGKKYMRRLQDRVRYRKNKISQYEKALSIDVSKLWEIIHVNMCSVPVHASQPLSCSHCSSESQERMTRAAMDILKELQRQAGVQDQ